MMDKQQFELLIKRAPAGYTLPDVRFFPLMENHRKTT